MSPVSTASTDAPAAGLPARWLSLFVPVLTGLAASTMLLVDYLKPAPVFCAQAGGCQALKSTAFAQPLGIPMPAFGVAGFALLGAALFLRGPRARAAQLALAASGALVGGFLLGVQVMLWRICVYCTVTDVSALVALFGAWWRARAAIDPPPGKGPLALAAGLAASSIATPVGFGLRMKPSVPPPILAELQKTPPGQITVVDFVDFQCPYCRQTHADLKPLLDAHRGTVRVVRKHVPLTFHMHALDAARASCCADELGKGEEMADELMKAPVAKLTPEGCAELASQLGMDVLAFKRCVADPKTDERIDADRATFGASGGEGLPTLYIDRVRIEGAQGAAVLGRALDAALASKGS